MDTFSTTHKDADTRPYFLTLAQDLKQFVFLPPPTHATFAGAPSLLLSLLLSPSYSTRTPLLFPLRMQEIDAPFIYFITTELKSDFCN
jgi:hypothetical protein